MARTEKAGITFAAAARIRSDHHAGPTWVAKGEKPIVQATGSRHGMSRMPATPSRGKMRLMIKDKSGVNAAVFIAFLQRLIAGARGVLSFTLFARSQSRRVGVEASEGRYRRMHGRLEQG